MCVFLSNHLSIHFPTMTSCILFVTMVVKGRGTGCRWFHFLDAEVDVILRRMVTALLQFECFLLFIYNACCDVDEPFAGYSTKQL